MLYGVENMSSLRMKNTLNNLPKSRKSRLKQNQMDRHSIHKRIRTNKPITSISEIEKLLSHDKPEGNGLSKIDGLFNFDNPKNAVELKKSQYQRSI